MTQDAFDQIALDVAPAGIFRRGIFDAMTGPAYFVAVALAGIGGLARDVGHPVGAAVLSTLLIWAGPAQIIFYGLLAAKATPAAIALAVCLSSIRFMPMCVSLLPLLRTDKTQFWTQLLASHFVSVTVWAECMRRVPLMPRDIRMAYFLGFATACILTSALFTAGGYYLLSAVPPILGAALLFVSPMYFLLAVMKGARGRLDWLGLGLGFVLTAPAVAFIGGGLDLLVVGLAGGSLAYVGQKWLARR